MIYVTHDQDEAAALGDRVAVFERGALQQVDCPDILCRRPANRFVAGFFGWPPMNLLDGRLAETSGQLFLLRDQAGLTLAGPRQAEWFPLAGRAVTLGIRPDDVRLGKERHEDTRLTMKVDSVESVGSTRFLNLKCDGWTVAVRLERETAPPEGTAVEVGFALEQAHLFDQESGVALAHAFGNV
jgi:ABC-type sugar transport system ATPase subunit